METTWQAPRIWRMLLFIAPAVIAPICRLRVTGDISDTLRRGPLILAANHVSPVDPIIMSAACRKARITPRFMATAGLFDAPLAGTVMRRAGHLRVDRNTAQVANALPEAAAALHANSTVLVYPEGRIGLDPWMWPERGKTGVARMAAQSGAPVVPVAQWGAHRVMPYGTPRGLLRSLLRALLTRPVVQVRFGEPVDLTGLTGAAGTQAVRATQRIIEGIDRTLEPLRPDEPQTPHHVDTSRPYDMTRVRPRPGR